MFYTPIHSGDTIYICGPMTGLPYSNYPAFNAMERYLENYYECKIVNPASNFGGDPTLPRESYMQIDISNLSTHCTGMVMLPNWEKSQGAITEFLVGSQLKLKMFDHHFCDIKPFDKKIILTKDYQNYELRT